MIKFKAWQIVLFIIHSEQSKIEISFGQSETLEYALESTHKETFSISSYKGWFKIKKGWSKFVRNTHYRDKIVEIIKGLGNDFYNWI